MVFACGVSNHAVGVFHLANHAFFKALLFLGAGSVIHAVADEQDMRRMGGLRRLIPFTYAMIFIGSFSLMGLPFFNRLLFKGCYPRSSLCQIYPCGSFFVLVRNISSFFYSFLFNAFVTLNFFK
jgi:NADH:ubiquinone oxidoreductase subunit 5 (subunit L)/multisubunit Na+/H+ antiporter MnhA subunit